MKQLSITLCLLFSISAFSSQKEYGCERSALNKAASMLRDEDRDSSSVSNSYSGEITSSRLLSLSKMQPPVVQHEILETVKHSDGDSWQVRYSIILDLSTCRVFSAFKVL